MSSVTGSSLTLAANGIEQCSSDGEARLGSSMRCKQWLTYRIIVPGVSLVQPPLTSWSLRSVRPVYGRMNVYRRQSTKKTHIPYTSRCRSAYKVHSRYSRAGQDNSEVYCDLANMLKSFIISFAWLDKTVERGSASSLSTAREYANVVPYAIRSDIHPLDQPRVPM